MFIFGLLLAVFASTSAQYNPYIQYGSEQQPYNPWSMYNPYYGVPADPYPYPNMYPVSPVSPVSPSSSIYSNPETSFPDIWRYPVSPSVGVPQPDYKEQPKHQIARENLTPKPVVNGPPNNSLNIPSPVTPGVNALPKPVIPLNPNPAQQNSPMVPSNLSSRKPNSPGMSPNPSLQPNPHPGQSLKNPSKNAMTSLLGSKPVNDPTTNKSQQAPVSPNQNKTVGALKLPSADGNATVVLNGTGPAPTAGNSNCPCPPSPR